MIERQVLPATSYRRNMMTVLKLAALLMCLNAGVLAYNSFQLRDVKPCEHTHLSFDVPDDVRQSGSYDTTAGTVEVDALTIGNTSVRTAGYNNLINKALYLNASGAQVNYALYTDEGAVQINGNTTLGDSNTDVTTINGRLIVQGRYGSFEINPDADGYMVYRREAPREAYFDGYYWRRNIAAVPRAGIRWTNP